MSLSSITVKDRSESIWEVEHRDFGNAATFHRGSEGRRHQMLMNVDASVFSIRVSAA